jgi:hypothetical protein
MRVAPTFAALALALTSVLTSTGCAVNARPYRFGSPMIGGADVPGWAGQPPDARLPDARLPDDPYADRDLAENRTTRPLVRVASAQDAEDVAADAQRHGLVWSTLPAPHRRAAEVPPVAVHGAADLRAFVGRRDPRSSAIAAVTWAHDLGRDLPPTLATGDDLVAWAERTGRLDAATAMARPGDLMVFDRTEGNSASDLVAVVVARDARGVTELVYVGGRVIRRGFVDPRRPALRRDAIGAVVNTYLRAGNRWPPKGTHYLAGELLAHVIRLD